MNRSNLDRFPLNGTFELTARCNLSCKMCMIRIDNERMIELGGRERTTEEWIKLAEEVFQAGTVTLLLTGGEPMLRPDFIRIYEAVAKMGFILTVFTNATLVTPEIMKVFLKYPPHRIGVTVYGSSPETYEDVTGKRQGYERMIEGLSQLKELPSRLSIRTTIIQQNLKDLDRMTEWARTFGDRINFDVSRIVTKPVRGGVSDVESCRLTPEQNVKMMKGRTQRMVVDNFNRFVDEYPKPDRPIPLKRQVSENPSMQGAESRKKPNRQTLYGCNAGMNGYTITWDGKLIGCQQLGDCWTYPFKEGFQAAWNRFPEIVNPPVLPEECQKCTYTCTACPATRLAETNSMSGMPCYLCDESKLTHQMEEEMKSKVNLIIKEKG